MVTELLTKLPPVLTDFQPMPTGRNFLPDVASALIARGELYLHVSYPPISATQYMDFCRTGNRVRFEDIYMTRRRALNALVMAEASERQGRFLDDVINGVFALCEESGWQLPPHNSYIRDTPQQLLPDVSRPVLDLFSCETGAQLAMVYTLLKHELNAVTPVICQRILSEIQTRIISPYLHEHFWWMGNGDEPMCNWTAWCTQNVLLATFSTGQTQGTKRKVIEKAAYSLDCFLKDYGEDGCCNEGAQYYRHAGLCLFNALEVMNQVSGGCFTSLFNNAKIRNMAAFILNMHVEDRYYLNFADCSPFAGRAGVREFLFGKRTNDPDLMDFAAEEWRKSSDRDLPEELNLFYRLQAALTAGEILAYHSPNPFKHRELYYPSVGIFIGRDDTYCLGVKAGCNGDSHNHNDTGSFTLYKSGRPFIIDVGVESYTKKTFSPQRYEIWTMQSAYHNLPAIGGVMQQDGVQYGAKDVQVCFGAEQSRISMDIAPAYPPEADLRTYLREAVLIKGQGVTVTDRFDGGHQDAVLSLMLCEQPVIDGPSIMVGNLGSVTADTDVITVERIPISDARLRTVWPETLWRILIRFQNGITLRIQ